MMTVIRMIRRYPTGDTPSAPSHAHLRRRAFIRYLPVELCGDSSVRPEQTLRETQESAHRLAGLVTKIARNLHRGFHEILPPESAPIAAYAKWRTPMNPSDSGE